MFIELHVLAYPVPSCRLSCEAAQLWRLDLQALSRADQMIFQADVNAARFAAQYTAALNTHCPASGTYVCVRRWHYTHAHSPAVQSCTDTVPTGHCCMLC